MSDSPTVRAVPAFDDVYRSEFRRVAGLAFVFCRDYNSAEDLAQDAFATAFRHWSDVSRMEHPVAWIQTVVVNKAMSRLRRMTRETRALRLGEPAQHEEGPAEVLAVWDAVAGLPVRQAQVVSLIYYSGLSHSEAAAIMGCKLETVRTHLKRAKAHLVKSLGEVQ